VSRRPALGALLLFLLGPAAAAAQPSDPLPGRLELALGGRWTGGLAFGEAEALETRASGGSFALFATDTELAASTAAEARLGVRLFRTVQIEASAAYASSDLRTRVSSDVEGIPDVTASESLMQFAFEGALLAHLDRWRLGRRTVPFVSAGGGFVRQLHEGRTLVDVAGTYHVGAGVRYPLATRGAARVKAIGVRAEVRAVVRIGGAAFDNRARVAPALGASLFLRL